MSEEAAAPLGERVARQRRRLGLSQVELGARLGRSESWVSQVERGVRSVDRLSVLTKLAEALGVPVAKLTGEAPEMVRVVDAGDIHHLRLAVVVALDGGRIGVWVGGHADDYVHWLDRSQVITVAGEWRSAPDGRGMWFFEERSVN